MPFTAIDSTSDSNSFTFFCMLCGRSFHVDSRASKASTRRSRDAHELACNGDSSSQPAEAGLGPSGSRVSYRRLTGGFSG